MSEKNRKIWLGRAAAGKQTKRKPIKIKILTVAVMLAGAILVVTSLILEAENYPWGRLIGIGSQSEESVPDPSPLDFPVVSLLPEQPHVSSFPQHSAVMTILPGAEEEDTATETLEDYNFQVLGIFKIPILKVSQNLLEGSGKQMKFGVGHVTGTAMPGEHGNCVIAGHRPWPFRYLDTLATGDNIIIKIGKMTYTYQVYDSFEVLPKETWVLENIWGEKYTLTVITCTPYMVSSHRLIVRARLTDINGQTPAEYFHEEVVTESPSPEPSPVPSPVSEEPSADPSAEGSLPPEESPTTSETPQESETPSPSESPPPTETPDVSASPDVSDSPQPFVS